MYWNHDLSNTTVLISAGGVQLVFQPNPLHFRFDHFRRLDPGQWPDELSTIWNRDIYKLTAGFAGICLNKSYGG
jgi:hypothetical protein